MLVLLYVFFNMFEVKNSIFDGFVKFLYCSAEYVLLVTIHTYNGIFVYVLSNKTQ